MRWLSGIPLARLSARRRSGIGLRLCGAFALILVVATVCSCRPTARRIAEDLAKATLVVETFDADGKPLSQGTAFYIEPDAVITNMHVMKWAQSVRLSAPTRGISIHVRGVVGVNFDRDLCVLRLANADGRPLRAAEAGSVAVGDRVFVAGNPRGLTGTVSTGIVSSIRTDSGLIQMGAALSGRQGSR